MLITLPCRRGTMLRRPTSWVTTNIAVTFKVITLFQPSRVCSVVGAPHDVPALLTRMSIGPSAAMTFSTIGAIVASSPMSQTNGSASMPSDLRCTDAASSSSRFRAVIATLAPSSPRTSAICRPRPRDPPVTSATRPVRSCNLTRLIIASQPAVPPLSSRAPMFQKWPCRLGALLRLQQLLKVGEVLLQAVLHGLPGVAARLRFHVREFSEIRERFLHTLLGGFSLFRHRFRAGGILDARLPLRERLLQDFVAPLDERPDALIGLPVCLGQRLHVLALPFDERRDVDAGQLEFLNQLFEIVEPWHRVCVRAGGLLAVGLHGILLWF